MNSALGYLARLLGGIAFWFVVLPWQQALRIRAGRHVRTMGAGIYLRVPILDAVKIESVRRRTSVVPTQTLSTADGATVVVSAVVAYAIGDLDRLYRSLHHAEDTIIQSALGILAAEIFGQTRVDLQPAQLCSRVSAQLAREFEPFGLSDVSLQLSDFAFVRALRLIQEQRWMHGRPLDTQDAAGGGVRT